jgi:hypothetical protein
VEIREKLGQRTQAEARASARAWLGALSHGRASAWSAERCNAELRRPGDNYITCEWLMRDTLIPVRCNRVFGGGCTGEWLLYFTIVKPFNARLENSCLAFSFSGRPASPRAN